MEGNENQIIFQDQALSETAQLQHTHNETYASTNHYQGQLELFLVNPGYLTIMNLKRCNMIILNSAKWRSSGEPSIPMSS